MQTPASAFPTPQGRGHYTLLALAALAPLVLVVLGLVLEPDPAGVGTHRQLGFPECTSLRLFGLPCPGCGGTTAVILAAHGELAKSFLTQPLGFLAALGATLSLPVALGLHLAGRDLAQVSGRLVRSRWGLLLLVYALAAWIYKIVEMT